MLGLVTSKKGALEKKDDIKRRIDAATKYIDLDQLALSHRNVDLRRLCVGNLLTEDAAVAREAWAYRRGCQRGLGRVTFCRSCYCNKTELPVAHKGPRNINCCGPPMMTRRDIRALKLAILAVTVL